MGKFTFKQVTKDQFYKFAQEREKNTRVELIRNINQMCEPPLMSLNDFSDDAQWPDSKVAYAKLYDGSEYHNFKSIEYFIREDEFQKYLENPK